MNFLKIFFIILFITIGEGYSTTIVTSDIGHYSFELPDGWRNLSEKQIESIAKELSVLLHQKPEEVFGWENYLIRESATSIEKPYIAIEVNEQPINDEIINLYVKDATEDYVKSRQSSQYKDMYQEIKTSEPIYFKDRHMWTHEVEAVMKILEHEERVKTYYVALACRYGIVKIKYQALGDNYAVYKKDVDHIVNSFKFDKEYLYDPHKAQQNLINRFLLYVVLFSILVFSIRRGIRRMREEKKESIQKSTN